ncbi:MAG TPA: hypothetical protein VLM89_11750, partial [Phycisphaerae bacterium]|nr:hypothetical protein [Phycisphaerae bacterium]
PELLDLCFELAGETAQADRVKASELEDRGWVVVEGVEIVPVTTVEYDEQRPVAMALVGSEQQVEFLKNWFDPQQIRQRVGWKDAQPPVPQDTKSEDASTTSPASEE